MTVAEAQRAVVGCLALLGVTPSAGLNPAGYAGVRLGTETATFQFVATTGALICRAHIYRFRGPAPDELIERLSTRLAQNPVASGGGALTLDRDVGLLSFSREYQREPTPAELLGHLKQLAQAAVMFDELLE